MPLLKTLFLLACFVTSTLIMAVDNWQYSQTPDWVKHTDYDLTTPAPIDHIQNGEFFRLIDDQFRVTIDAQIIKYKRFAVEAVNQKGKTPISQINIEFDPKYQHINLHSLNIIRGSEIINKLKSTKLSVLQREKQLEKQTYNGLITLNALLTDIRVGDVVDYSYSIVGSNPVYDGLFDTRRTFQWSDMIGKQSFRVLWGKQNPLYFNQINGDLELQVNQLGNFTEYSFVIERLAPSIWDSQSPNWYQPYGKAFFSELSTWKEVIEWARPLYQNAVKVSPEVKKIAEEIQEQHASKKAQIAAALRYTQNEIRYLGLQDGLNSHRPVTSEVTLQRRFGDCKAKTILLISLLKALDIESNPVLVDNDDGQVLDQRPVSINSFDHVIVTLELENQRYWLDPTIEYQVGPLDSLYQPDYGFGLILSSDASTLTAFGALNDTSKISVTEQFHIPESVEEPVKFNVSSIYTGVELQGKLSQIDKNGINQITNQYTEYYQRFYPGLTSTEPVSYQLNEEVGKLTVSERYSVSDIWEKQDNDYQIDFYASDISGYLYKPDATKRNAPLSLSYPVNASHTLEVYFEEKDWDFKDSVFEKDTDNFYFKKQISFKDNILKVQFSLQTKRDHVPVEQIETYLVNREIVYDKAYYGILKYGEESTQTSEIENYDFYLWFGIYLLSLMGAWIVAFTLWRFRAKTRPENYDSVLPAISPIKFSLLTIFSLGIYTMYWNYRVWRTLNKKHDLEIIPVLRGIFSIIFYLPLYLSLIDNAEREGEQRKIMPMWAAILLFTVYLAGTFNMFYLDSFGELLYMLVLTLPYLPLVIYINQSNGVETVKSFNSKVSLHFIIFVTFSIPVFSVDLLQKTNLIPATTVVKGNKIKSWDKDYLIKSQLIPNADPIIYFYSDDLFSIRNDGSGFTKNTLFTYWKEGDEMNKASASFSEVKAIEITWAEDDVDNTYLKVIKHDESWLTLTVSAYEGKDKEFIEGLANTSQDMKILLKEYL
ncbi:DUF3857 domain-containing transglutaminase family protein [Pseudoalteromonas phenolica]|uniref:DUF3857 domain-containing transglutaminase family protein n=1 Tax=Pseudoalteromonas phenolica TaxID=161398 RepID=UPI00110B194D|nr:DUF3857 domain-containing protein [Pseudoalteromonas phenolica]TMO57663.1 hypothetical protein CWC21_02170 [Pseudoalteromonas phenolica]